MTQTIYSRNLVQKTFFFNGNPSHQDQKHELQLGLLIYFNITVNSFLPLSPLNSE